MLNPRVVVDSDFIAELLTLNLINLLDVYVTNEMNKALKGINLSQNVPVPLCPVINVVNVTVNGQTEVQIQFSLPVTTPRVITVTPIFGLSKAMGATEFAQAQNHEDGEAPLTVEVETAESFGTDNGAAYALVVKSQRQEAGQINVSLALPAGVTANDGLIEITDANGTRTLAANFSTGANGEAVLNFADHIEASAEQRYHLNLRFLSGATEELKLTATVSDAAGATLESTTLFQRDTGVIKPRGTFQATRGLKAQTRNEQ
jgi:hypothetical protein